MKLKKISKLALLAAFSYSNFSTAFSTTYDVAGVFGSIPHDERMGRADNWLTKTGHNTAGVKALANAAPNMIIALAKRDGSALKAIVEGLQPKLTDADKNYAVDELTKLVRIATTHSQPDLAAKLAAYRTAISNGATGSAVALDILATMGLFGKMENAVAVWNAQVKGQSISNITAYLNSISLALVYMINGNGDAAKALAEGQTAFTETEKVLWKTFIGYALNGTPANGQVPLVNQIEQESLRSLAIRFTRDFAAAIDPTNAPERTPAPSPFPTFDERELVQKYTTGELGAQLAAAGVTSSDVSRAVNTYSPDKVTVETLQNRELSESDTQVLTVIAKNDPVFVAGLLSSYFEKSDYLTSVTDGNYVPPALVTIAQEHPHVVSSLIQNGGFIDLSTATPSGGAIPKQVVSIISTMTPSNSAVAMQNLIDQLPSNGRLPIELRLAQGTSTGF